MSPCKTKILKNSANCAVFSCHLGCIPKLPTPSNPKFCTNR